MRLTTRPAAALRPRAVDYRSRVLASNPIAYWRFDASPGQTISEVNQSQMKLSLLAGSVTSVAGLWSGSTNAASFSSGYYGIADSASAPSFRTRTEFSVEWIGSNFAQGNILGAGSVGSGQLQIRVGAENLYLVRSGVVEATGFILLPSLTAVHHGAITYTSDGYARYYVNGSLRQTQYVAASFVNTVANLLIGFSSADVNLSGTLDELALYGRVLTPTEIAAHARAAGFTVADDPTFLSTVSTARAIYSTRAINGYSGNIFDVRRSSDNATTSIGLSNGELDTATLASWGGSDSVYVSKWYDQSGNGHHLLQATNANQPRLVNAGTLETQNGLPIVNCVTSTWLREGSPYSVLDASDVTILSANNGTAYTRGEDGSGSGWSLQLPATGKTSLVFTASGAANYTADTTLALSGFKVRGLRVRNGSGGGAAGNSWITAESDGAIHLKTALTSNRTFRTSTVGGQLGRGADGSSVLSTHGEMFIWRELLTSPQVAMMHADMKRRYAI